MMILVGFHCTRKFDIFISSIIIMNVVCWFVDSFPFPFNWHFDVERDLKLVFVICVTLR